MSEEDEYDATTVRAYVNREEHADVKFAAKRCNMTVSDFVKEAIVEHIHRSSGYTIEELRKVRKSRTNAVQLELF